MQYPFGDGPVAESHQCPYLWIYIDPCHPLPGTALTTPYPSRGLPNTTPAISATEVTELSHWVGGAGQTYCLRCDCDPGR
jgi:hypothetical protein